jgi:hypothetical protein
VELDVEKALDEQLFFEAFRTKGPATPTSISGWPILGGGHSSLGHRDFGLNP